MFNKDLLTQCRELHFKGQHMDLVLPLKIINEEEEYKVEEVRNHSVMATTRPKSNSYASE